MIGSVVSRCIYLAAPALIAFAVLLLMADTAHAHSEPVEVDLHLENTESPAEHSDGWTPGHCHGGPYCTGGLFLSEVIRPDGIARLSRARYYVVQAYYSGQLPVRDPPIPISRL